MQADVVLPWLTERRWFAGKGRPVREARVVSSDWLADEPRTRVEFVTVHYASDSAVSSGGGERATETYQVPVVYRDARVEALDHALIGTTLLNGEEVWAYDAAYDREAVALWPSGMRADRSLGDLTFHQDSSLPEADEESFVMKAEQSNTSVVFGNEAILKIFRRLSPGENPDVELHRALGEAGNGNVARLLGWAEGSWANGNHSSGPASDIHKRGTLAVISEFLPSTTQGWDLALTSVRDLFAQPSGVRAAEAGGDFAGEARRLGQATAAVHADLAKVLGADEFDARGRAALIASMEERLTAACAVAPELAAYAGRVRDLHQQLANWPGTLARQRVHGDLHLGQVLLALTGWRILDFEGEPARPMEQRRLPDSPLRDVGGMLRSFDYAAGQLLGATASIEGAEPTALARARDWTRRNQEAFLAGYWQHSPGALPSDPLPLRLFTLDKACYEVLYEARNRPDWLHLPLRAVAALATEDASNVLPGEDD
ncbi:MAG: maltokinase N-terminal cap-like domain-containing protein [Sporichthyaceae bacterium]